MLQVLRTHRALARIVISTACKKQNTNIEIKSFYSTSKITMPQYEYPKTRRDDSLVENHHGVDV